MAKGSPTKEEATDQQCSECDHWFHWRGISEHQKNCTGETNQQSDRNTFDPAGDADPGAGADATTPETMPDDSDNDEPDECPECGGTDSIIASREAIEMYRESDEVDLSGSQLDTLLSYDWYHNDASCRGVFNE